MKCIQDEIPFEVPEGWEWCRLNSIAMFELGKTLDSAKNTGIYKPYLRSVNVRWNSMDLNDIKNMKFEPDELTRYSIRKGDLLICEGGDVGRSCVWEKEDEMYYQNALHRVRFYMNINPYFYMYIMMYYANSGKLQEICKGVTIKHLTRATLLMLLFPLPPQNESLHIVNKILEFDSLLQNMEENKNDISYLISNTKSKILDLAIRGKLVPQDPNDEPASVLLERIKGEKEKLIKQGKIKRDKKESLIFKDDDNSYYESIGNKTISITDEIPFEIPQNWGWSRLQTICYPITDGTHKTPTYADTGYIFLSAKNITAGKINWNDVMYIPKSLHDELHSRISPQIDDILLAKNGTTGVAAIVDRDCEFDIYVTLALLRVINNNISPQYLLKIIASTTIQDYFNSSLKGIGVPNLHLEHIRTTLIPIPPINEQKRISEKVSQLFSLLDSIARI